jgi:hypothetical protein
MKVAATHDPKTHRTVHRCIEAETFEEERALALIEEAASLKARTVFRMRRNNQSVGRFSFANGREEP